MATCSPPGHWGRLWATCLSILVCCLGISGCQGLSPQTPAKSPAEQLGVLWQPVEGNPQLIGGACFSWRCAGVGDPAIKRLPQGSLIVWFTTLGIHRSAEDSFVADGPWIGRSVGSDQHSPKLTISPEHPVISVGPVGLWDRYIETPSALWNAKSQRWWLWYLGYQERSGPTGFLHPAIGQMSSLDPDGKQWQRPPAPIYRPEAAAWDSLLVTGPTVLQGPDGLWRLYYSGWGITGSIAHQGIGLLTSRDGLHWQPYGDRPVLEGQSGSWDAEILEPAVIYFQGQYWMWYSGRKPPFTPKTAIAIGLATSVDGLHWSRYPANPVLQPGPQGSWNDGGVLAPDVLVEADGSLLMAAYGQSQQDRLQNRSSGSIGFWRSR